MKYVSPNSSSKRMVRSAMDRLIPKCCEQNSSHVRPRALYDFSSRIARMQFASAAEQRPAIPLNACFRPSQEPALNTFSRCCCSTKPLPKNENRQSLAVSDYKQLRFSSLQRDAANRWRSTPPSPPLYHRPVAFQPFSLTLEIRKRLIPGCLPHAKYFLKICQGHLREMPPRRRCHDEGAMGGGHLARPIQNKRRQYPKSVYSPKRLR